ncbi:MAG: PorT family protein [Cyclobacteriaceae bacterium]|nr:PorT family protein [Cyclobacteriaceae bacterium]
MKTIKTIILLAFLSLMVSYGADAQSFRPGIKGGVNFSNLFIDEVDDKNARIGFHAGIFAQILGAGETVGFQPELLYSTKGSKGQYDFVGFTGEQKFNLNYIDLPLMLLIKVGEVLDINAGGYVSYLVNSSVSTDGTLGEAYQELDRDNFNSVDYGLVGGLALNIDIVSIGARYNYGLRQVANGTAAETFLGDANNSVAQVYLGIVFSK